MGRAGTKQNTKADESLPRPPPSSSFMFTRHSVYRTAHLSGTEYYHAPFQGFYITHAGPPRLLLILSPFYRPINRDTDSICNYSIHTPWTDSRYNLE